MSQQRSIGLMAEGKIGIDVPPLPPLPPPNKLDLGWGAAYKVGSDLSIGDTLTVDFSGSAGVLGVAVALQEIKGLDFGTGGPSDTPWADLPFGGSVASGDNDYSYPRHTIPVTFSGPADYFGDAGLRSMSVLTDYIRDEISWVSPDAWIGSEQGYLNMFGHLGWRFVIQDDDTMEVDANDLGTTFGLVNHFGYGYNVCVTSGDVEIGSIVGKNQHAHENIITVPLTADIIAPSGLAVISLLSVDIDVWGPFGSSPEADIKQWPVITDSTESVDNFAKGRVLTGAGCFIQ